MTQIPRSLKTPLAAALMAVLFFAGVIAGAGAAKTPKTVLHVITVKWKDTATAEQRQAALDATLKMAANVPGLTNIWLKTLKVQGDGFHNVIAMEFKDEAAFRAYATTPAHAEWEKVYLPLRQQSTTHDVTN